jgi:uncharacterized membrane protein YeaQ/YmgE (transglycosylase-associated protein family)
LQYLRNSCKPRRVKIITSLRLLIVYNFGHHKVKEERMLINLIAWIIFGALAGWIASMIMKTNAQQGALGNIIVGILGAFIGGFLVRTLTGNDVSGFNLASLIVAILGAVILLAIVRAFRGGTAHRV